MVDDVPSSASGNAYATPVADRPQPHDLNAERAVLSSMLRQARPCVEIAIEQLGASSEVFYSHIHREVYDAILALHKQGENNVDVLNVAHYLRSKNRLDAIGGDLFLMELAAYVGTTANLESWCQIIRDLSILRKMIVVCSESLVKCFNAEVEARKIVEEIETDIFRIRNQSTKSEIVPIREGVVETFKKLDAILKHQVEVGIPTGFPSLDQLTAGLKPGEMFVLAARPSIGKTTMALNIIRNIALKGGPNGRPIAFFSLEMTTDQIVRRLLCTEAGISESVFYDNSFRNEDMTKLTRAVETYRNAKIFIDPTGGLTIADLRAKARRLFYNEKIELVVIDYLQLMKAGIRTDSRQQEVAEISSGIKQLAKELNVPVLVLAQLNREIEKTAGASSRPKLSHLRESGAIEQDADIVAFLHRDRDEAKVITPENRRDGLEAELIVEKNRNGRTGYVKLRFFPERMEFVNESRFGADEHPNTAE